MLLIETDGVSVKVPQVATVVGVSSGDGLTLTVIEVGALVQEPTEDTDETI